MDEEASTTVQVVVFGLSIGLNVVLLYMSIVGQRMTRRASRWHVINSCVWNIAITVLLATYGYNTPWKNLKHAEEIEINYTYIKQFLFTTFHNGVIFVFIETLIVFFFPSLANSFIFSLIWIFLICGLANLLLLLCFLARLYWGFDVSKVFWYDPLAVYQIVVVQLFGLGLILYTICALIVTIFSCTRRVKHTKKHLLELWLTLLYGAVPYAAFLVASGLTFMQFMGDKNPDLIEALMQLMSGGDPEASIKLMLFLADSITWTEIVIPLVDAISAFLFLTSYSEQFLFVLSCGRMFPGERISQRKKLKIQIDPEKIFIREISSMSSNEDIEMIIVQ